MECCKTLAGAVQGAFRSRSDALPVDLKSHPSVSSGTLHSDVSAKSNLKVGLRLV